MSMKTVRLALAQINPTVGDLQGNAKKIIDYIGKAKGKGADVVAFPELALTGYPPEDLLLKPRFIEDNLRAIDSICKKTHGIVAVVGFVDKKSDIYNAAAVVSQGKLIDVYHKIYLPNYGIVDEYRYFQAGARYPVYRLGDVTMGVNICEDMWYPEGPARMQALEGAELVININASPYTIGKAAEREKMLSIRAVDSAVVLAYVNIVGAQDELVFEGQSFVINEKGDIIARARQFEEDLLVVDLDIEAVFMRRLHDPRRRQQTLTLDEGEVDSIEIPIQKSGRKKKLKKEVQEMMGASEEAYSALVLGVSDYVRKNEFKGVIIGLSGGIDSSLVAAIAVDALGAKNVKGIFMPSPYTSRESREDALMLAKNLGMDVTEIPITSIFDSYLKALKKPFKGKKRNTAEENLQARIRGNLLMAMSNKFGLLVLATGNKSEMSVGYATLYGDMAGGFAVIKDVSKTLAYEFAAWRNRKAGRSLIPERVLTKDPTAELKPDQRDTDSLPPYPVLDTILKAYVEDEKNLEEMIEFEGCEPDCAKSVISMIDRNEYKRRQSPPGIKITQRAFGKDRRFPITNRYRGY
jgi:NAD+ synthase (glutamine-hydrolysing)